MGLPVNQLERNYLSHLDKHKHSSIVELEILLAITNHLTQNLLQEVCNQIKEMLIIQIRSKAILTSSHLKLWIWTNTKLVTNFSSLHSNNSNNSKVSQNSSSNSSNLAVTNLLKAPWAGISQNKNNNLEVTLVSLSCSNHNSNRLVLHLLLTCQSLNNCSHCMVLLPKATTTTTLLTFRETSLSRLSLPNNNRMHITLSSMLGEQALNSIDYDFYNY